jgi:hypothetical protein
VSLITCKVSLSRLVSLIVLVSLIICL